MSNLPDIDTALQEIETGIKLTKCQQCGCMSETLQQIGQSAQVVQDEGIEQFLEKLPDWNGELKPIRYSCLGCEHCYAGAAQNAFTSAFPQAASLVGLSCEIQTNTSGWPPIVGEYTVLDQSSPVAIATLASLEFARQIADLHLPGLAIVGKLETENIGIDKLIKNTIANPNLRFLILAGIDPAGHQSGQTVLALSENGVDEKGRVIGSKGKHPVLRNVTQAEVETFRKQIQVIDLIGCECTECVGDKIAELRERASDITPVQPSLCGCSDGSCQIPSASANDIPTLLIEATDQAVKLDRAGYFVVLPIKERNIINVEHYSYDNSLLHILEGTNARGLYLKIIEEGWVTEMSHAAYIGKELAKAELSLAYGIPYAQDAA